VQGRRDRSPGTLIRVHREAAGLTQRQLAETARVSIGVVRDLEQGLTVRPRAETVRRLASALGLDGRKTENLLATAPRQPRTLPAARTLEASGGPSGLRISVLGPLTAWRDGSFIPLGPEMQRAVLGLLALHSNTSLHREVLIDALWGDAPPATAVAMIQSYISRLRRLLDPAEDREGQSLITSGTSYRLCIAADELDQMEFSQLTAHAQDAHAAGELSSACQLYARALDLWRAEPLADVKVLSSNPAVLDLGHQRAAAVVSYADAAFSAGWHDRVLRQMRALYHREPLNERVAARLMIALAGSGCQAAALGVYDEVRQRLDDQLGVYPCAELADTQAMVLRQQIPSACAAAGDRATLRAIPSGYDSRQWPPDGYLAPGHPARAAQPSARSSLSVLRGGGDPDDPAVVTKLAAPSAAAKPSVGHLRSPGSARRRQRPGYHAKKPPAELVPPGKCSDTAVNRPSSILPCLKQTASAWRPEGSAHSAPHHAPNPDSPTDGVTARSGRPVCPENSTTMERA
jgi:DNA-binding SARP family transcriptional activator/DNA-binding XRE family transcriptional regulator